MDPISDMLTMIRNAQAVFKPEVFLPFSKMKYQIAQILEQEGFIKKAEKRGRGPKKNIKIALKYLDKIPTKDKTHQPGQPVIAGLKKISKPGQRIYLSAKKIRPARKGLGIIIVSTSQGIMTSKEARKKNLGGEIICEIW